MTDTTDLDYLNQAERLLKAVEECCDRLNDQDGVDIDNQRVGGMITLTFANGSQIIVNLQKPLHEVWLASKAGGFHYHLRNGAWFDTKSQGEFFEELSRHASSHAGTALRFSA